MALEYAEAMTLSDVGMGDELMVRLKRHFDDDAIVGLSSLIASRNIVEQVQRRPRRAAAGLLSSAAGAAGRRGRANRREGAVMPMRLIVTGGVLIPVWPALAGAERYGPGMMWGGWFHMFFGFLLMILLLGIIVALVVLGVRWLGRSEHSPFRQGSPQGRRPALEILEERLARGEIDVGEFEERRRALGE